MEKLNKEKLVKQIVEMMLNDLDNYKTSISEILENYLKLQTIGDLKRWIS